MQSNPKLAIHGRAQTHEAKRAILDRIYEVWTDGAMTHLRLGQLLEVAVEYKNPGRGPDVFNVEDEELARLAEVLAEELA